MVKYDAAALELSMQDYASALRDIDEYFVVEQKVHHQTEPNSASLVRCAALIGLNRMVEADKEMQDLLRRFDFNGQSPWEGILFGPHPIDPYQTTRRLAAHYMREANYPADILEDKSAVYIATGRDDRADALLLASLRIRKKTQNRELKRILTKLAELRTRSGHRAPSQDFCQSRHGSQDR